jgi:hypothetical protein
VENLPSVPFPPLPHKRIMSEPCSGEEFPNGTYIVVYHCCCGVIMSD